MYLGSYTNCRSEIIIEHYSTCKVSAIQCHRNKENRKSTLIGGRTVSLCYTICSQNDQVFVWEHTLEMNLSSLWISCIWSTNIYLIVLHIVHQPRKVLELIGHAILFNIINNGIAGLQIV